MNTILDDNKRVFYAPLIQTMKQRLPNEMARKIERANVQQAWMVETFFNLANKESHHLCVGSYEDTAFAYLLTERYNITGIDPVINHSLHDFANMQNQQYQIVFSTSVIEHVENDEEFITDMCRLIEPGGYGLLTCDYNPNYPNVPKPIVDARLYNDFDLNTRIPTLLQSNGFAIYGDINYTGNIDFHYEGCNYAFATIVFWRTK